jgi:hypothetical protein
MKYKIYIITTLILITFVAILLAINSRKIEFEEVRVEELDKDIQLAIEQINKDYDQNIFFIIKDKTIIVYSNLSKSGMYTYPYAEIIQRKNKLVVNIKSDFTRDVKHDSEIVIVKINNINKLPDEIETTFLDKQTDYEIIDLTKK